MLHAALHFAADEDGGPGIEWGLIAAILSIVIIGFLNNSSIELNEIFTDVASGIRGR